MGEWTTLSALALSSTVAHIYQNLPLFFPQEFLTHSVNFSSDSMNSSIQFAGTMFTTNITNMGSARYRETCGSQAPRSTMTSPVW